MAINRGNLFEKKYNSSYEYDYTNEMFEAAGEYYRAVLRNLDNNIMDRSTMVDIQLATECYLKSIIETLYQKSMFELSFLRKKISMKEVNPNYSINDFRQDGDISHNLKHIYNDFLYPKNDYIGNRSARLVHYEELKKYMKPENIPGLPKRDNILSKELDNLFAVYNNIRLPGDKSIQVKLMEVTENDISDMCVEILDKVKEIATDYHDLILSKEELRDER